MQIINTPPVKMVDLVGILGKNRFSETNEKKNVEVLERILSII